MKQIKNQTTLGFDLIPRKEGSGRPTNKPLLKDLKKDYASMSVKEISQKYGVKEATVKTWVYRARKGEY